MDLLEPRHSDDEHFADRSEAGALLGERLRHHVFSDPLILALPRGGVPVAYEVSRRLGIPMEVLVARKIGLPGNPEYAIGAMVEGGVYHLDQELVESLHIGPTRIQYAIEKERREIRRRIAVYRMDQPLPRVKNRDILLIDDGIATGETARAACHLLRNRGVNRIVLAVPVAPARMNLEKNFPEASEFIALRQPTDFQAVGQFYARFTAVSDEAVAHLAARGRLLKR